MATCSRSRSVWAAVLLGAQLSLPLAGATPAPGASPGGEDEGWFAFDPPEDQFATSPIDLRFLNEKWAGEHGFIQVREGHFVHEQTSKPVRFWAVNGPPSGVGDPAELRRVARRLAKYGINLVRVHSPMFDKRGEPDPGKVRRALDIVEAMKAEGIYTHFSIYFPLWFRPPADLDWLAGYDGNTHAFAALQFNPAFQERYRRWWTALLTTESEKTGKALIDEPAVMGVEIQNEDSFFFWTFSQDRIPEPQWRLLERQFGDWLRARYGSIDAALARWGGAKEPRDHPAEGLVTFRPLWNMANQKTLRDQDTARFLFEVQSAFYRETLAFLRKLGFKGRVTASNWATASPEVLGPLEKLSYTTTDFIDRHGYFGCGHQGEHAEWSLRDGHTYADRSALRFDPEKPGGPKAFVHPVMDVRYDDKPSMISETTFNRPNRYRTEAPLYFAAYGALQDTDAIVHFAFDGAQWGVKPGYWMQPWTLMSPAMVGQFPAAALIYRRGLIAPGDVLATVSLSTNDLLALKGTPLPQDASFDELRAKDVPQGSEWKAGQRIDPLIHYAGRTQVRFGGETSVKLNDLRRLIDRTNQHITSSTGELGLDYRNGVMILDAPQAQGVSGSLQAAGTIHTRNLTLTSDLDVGAIVVVSLDGNPLRDSFLMLLQAVSEEKATGFATEPADPGRKKIGSIGRDPWMMRGLAGVVEFKRAAAGALRATPLDFNGYPAGEPLPANGLRLQPRTIYYLITL
jgi:hypothetical protein